MNEGDLKRTVEDYLQIKQNQGELMFLRLNSGMFFLPSGGGKYRAVKGCPRGTADLMVIEPSAHGQICQVIFLELKSKYGKQTKEQKEFEKMVWDIGCWYWIIRDLEELMPLI